MDIQIKNIGKKYPDGTQALLDINISLSNGMFGLLGPNGAGKTTLMRIIATLLQPTQGDVLVNNISLRKKPAEIRRLLGYLPQSFNVYPQLTVEEFLDYFALLSEIKQERTTHVYAILEKVNLIEQKNVRTGKLSGGMKRRLGIAQALLNDPGLLIVDEPTAGLDPAERVRFRNLLASLSSERIVILSTHIVEDVASTCYNLAILDHGQILLHGTPKQLTDVASKKVWTAHVTQSEWDQMQLQYHILSTVRQDSGWQVRMLAEQPPTPNATNSTPTIEDGYMYLMQRGN